MPKHSFGANAPSLPDPTRRRVLHDALAGVAVVSAGAGALAVAATDAQAALESDPALAAISAHRIATRNVDTSKSEDESPEWHAALDLERDAWLVLTRTAPTSVAGLVAYTSYLAGIGGWRDTIVEGWTEAVHSIALANARLFPREAARAAREMV